MWLLLVSSTHLDLHKLRCSNMLVRWILVMLALAICFGVAGIVLRAPPEANHGPTCGTEADCIPDTTLTNRLGFSVDQENPLWAEITGGSLTPADNFVLSWDRSTEWTTGVIQAQALRRDFAFASANQRLPVLTVEPWPARGKSSRTLLLDITHGNYDNEIRWLCEATGEYGMPVVIRWGHEMENITGRYPWATRDAQAYVDAYRYFVTRCASLAPNAQYMWSPAGNKNLKDYWPGEPYVDYIGITVYNYEAWEIRYYGYSRPFKENFEERYARVKDYRKPIMIAEFGATGPTRTQWISEALQEVNKYILIKSVLFFSAMDPVSWGPLPPPDWRPQSVP